jgi:hypothetical protein
MLSPLAEASVTGQASRRDARAEGRCASKALSPPISRSPTEEVQGLAGLTKGREGTGDWGERQN